MANENIMIKFDVNDVFIMKSMNGRHSQSKMMISGSTPSPEAGALPIPMSPKIAAFRNGLHQRYFRPTLNADHFISRPTEETVI